MAPQYPAFAGALGPGGADVVLDQATNLAAARDRLELMHAENLSVAGAFGLSYHDLDGGQQRLFRRLGLHPGPDIDAYAAAALDDTTVSQARRGLEDLYDQHLITQPAPGRYRFHDLIREHARTLADADNPAESEAAARRLLDYYQNAALAAVGHITMRVRGSSPPQSAQPPTSAPSLSTPAQAVQWLEAERPNLHAAAGYAAAHGHHQYAAGIAAAADGFLFARGYWDQVITMQRTALAAARQAGNRPAQAAALNHLCLAQALAGDTSPAMASNHQAMNMHRELGDMRGQGDTLHSLSLVCQRANDYSAAVAAAAQALELYRQAGDQTSQVDGLNQLGFSQALAGDYPAAAKTARQALELSRDLDDKLGQAVALEYLGWIQLQTSQYPAATASYQQALRLDREIGQRQGEGAALIGLGDVQRLTGDYPAAAASYQQALEIFRDDLD